MTGTGKSITGGGKTLANLTISNTSGTITLSTSDLTVSSLLTVSGLGGSLTIGTSRTLTLSGNTGTTLTLTGTITGAGTLLYQNSATAFPATGTMSSLLTLDTLNGNLTIPNRTFGGAVTGKNTTASARQLIFAASSTPTFSAGMNLITTGTGTLLLDGATNNPATVTVTGNFTTTPVNGAVTVSMGSGNWSVSGNFDLTNVTTFNHNSGTITMSGTGTLTSNGKTLNNLTTSGSGTVTLANAALAIANDLTLGSSSTFVMGSATPSVAGSVTLAGTVTANTSTLTMTGTGKSITGGGKTLKNFAIGVSATVTANSSFSVSGDWTNNGGTFTPGAYEITLSATTGIQTVTGNTSFYDLTIPAGSGTRTVKFADGSTTTVSHNWSVSGSLGNEITLTRSSTSSAWTINPTAATVTYTTVSWSNSGLAICATYSTDGGNNNANWSFNAGASCVTTITLSGTVYSDEGTTPITGTPTVRIKVNGVGDYSVSASTGAYSISSITANSGDVVTIYLDTNGVGSVSAALVTVSDGITTTGLNLYQNTLIVRYETGTSITNTNLGQYDKDDDTDIHFTSNAGVLAVDSDYELHVWTGKTFAPGGATTASGSVHVDGGTLALATNNLTVGATGASGVGSITGSGTITSSASSTTTLRGTGTLGSGTYSFYNLILGDGISTRTTTLIGSVTVANLLTTASQHTLDGNTATLTLSGTSGTVLSNNGIFAPSSSTVVYSGANAAGNTRITDVAYYNLQLTGADTYDLGADNFVTGVLTIGVSATFAPGTYTVTLSGTGTPFVVNGTFTPSTSIVSYSGNSPTVAATTYNELYLSGSGTETLGSGTLSVAHNVSITSGSVTAATNNPAIQIGYSLLISNGATYTKGSGTTTLSGVGSFVIADMNSTKQDLGVVVITGTYSLNSSVKLTSLSGAGSLTLNSNTLTLAGSGTPLGITTLTASDASTVTYTSGSGATVGAKTYYNLTINGSGTFSTGGNVVANNDLTISGGTLALGANDLQVGSTTANSGSIKVASGQSLTQSASNTTTVFGSLSGNNCIGSDGVNCSGTAGTITLGNLTVGNGTTASSTTVGGTTTLTVGGVLTIAANHTLNASGSTVTLAGTSGTPFVATGTFTPSTSTVVYSGANAVGNTNVTAAAYNNVQVTGSDTYDLAGDTTVSGVLTIGTGAVLDGKTRTLTLSGTSGTPFVATGTFTPSTSTVVYSGDNAGGSTTVVPVTYNNLTLDNASETFVAGAGTVTANGNLNVNAGTFDLTSSNAALGVVGNLTIGGTLTAPANAQLTVYGDWTNNGTFTHSNSTVVIASPDANSSTSNVGGSAGTDFYNLTIVSPAKTVRFAAQKTFGVAGTFTATGGGANTVNLYSSTIGAGSSSVSQWLLNLTGSSNFSLILVQNAGCATGSNHIAPAATIMDRGNNDTSCWGFTSLGGNSSNTTEIGSVTGRLGGGGLGTPQSGGNVLGGNTTPSDNAGGGTPTGGGTNQGSGGSSTRSD
ncbi:MAG: hypothetical protein WC817_04835 [Patescibacteria group bacterium]